MKIVALAGGVGGAKLCEGLAKILTRDELTIVVNTADDMELFGLHISPDLDTVCYTLAGLSNPETGWGQAGESWNVYNALIRLEAPDWFHLGDRDIALHMERTRLLEKGFSLTEVTEKLCHKIGVFSRVFPMSDQPVRTKVHTKEGKKLSFQEYFVRERCQPEVSKFEFTGINSAEPQKDVLAAIRECDLVIICPSNPWVSIDPILKLPKMWEELKDKKVVAVSPIIGGKTIKGPAAKMFTELGIEPNTKAVALHYQYLLSGLILDKEDREESEQINAWGIMTLVTNTIMRSINDRVKLAEQTINFGLSLPSKG